MRARDCRTLTALCAARQFLHDHAEALPALTESDLPRHLDAIIAAIRSHATDQGVHGIRVHSVAATQHTLRRALLCNHMTPIVRIARADLPHTPEFKVLRMPSGRPTIDQLASAASAMAAMAERFTDTFVAAGLPPSFVEALHAAIRGLTDMRDEATLARGRRHGAARGVDTAIVQGHHTLRALDTLISTALRGDHALLANWRAVIATPRLGRPRIQRTRRRATAAPSS